MSVMLEIEYLKRKQLEEEDPLIVKQWKEIIKTAEKNDISSAYLKALEIGDDLYLLRLLCLSGPCLNKLNYSIAKQVLFRVNMIAKGHQFQNIILSVIQASVEYKLFTQYSNNEKNILLDTLYEFSSLNSKIGQKAALLYSSLSTNTN